MDYSGCSGGGEWEKRTPWAVLGVAVGKGDSNGGKMGVFEAPAALGALDDTWADADAAE